MTSKGQQTMENLEVVFRFRFISVCRQAGSCCLFRTARFALFSFINFGKPGWLGAFREFPHGDVFSMEIVSKQCSLCYMQELATAVRTLKELDEWKSKVDSASSSLQMILPQPAVLFNPYVAIVALQEVVNVTKDKEDDRATSFQIVLRQCHRLVNSPNLQQILIKLVATKEEADVAKVLAKATKEPASVHQGAFRG